MIISKYGIELREIEREDLEMIRQYRNSSSIKENMIFKETISRADQKKWFEKVRNSVNCAYYLIYKDEIAMGLINGMNINHKDKSSEGGIFVWHKEANYSTTILASIILNDWNFFFNGFECNYAQVLRKNKQAIAYNEFMGYKISIRKHDNPKALWMEQSKAAYFKFRRKVQSLGLVDFDISSHIGPDDLSIEDHEVEHKKKIIAKLPKKQQKLYEDLLSLIGKL